MIRQVRSGKAMAKGSQVDFLVVGAGVAGLRAAVELARHGEVLVVTKESLGESNTHYAQGGIAVAMEGDEDIALHLEDTVNAGDGLVYRPAAEALVNEGPLRVAELIEWGANFDRDTGPEGVRPGGQLPAHARGRAFPGPHSACERRRYRRRDQPLAGRLCPRPQAHPLCRVDAGFGAGRRRWPRDRRRSGQRRAFRGIRAGRRASHSPARQPASACALAREPS